VEIKSKDLVEKINVRMAGKEAKKIRSWNDVSLSYSPAL
jgi:hypothetical protein